MQSRRQECEPESGESCENAAAKEKSVKMCWPNALLHGPSEEVDAQQGKHKIERIHVDEWIGDELPDRTAAHQVRTKRPQVDDQITCGRGEGEKKERDN